MNQEQLLNAIAVLWNGNQSRAARDLGISDRTIRRYLAPASAASHQPIPPGIIAEINDLLNLFPDGIQAIDPRRSIAILLDRMQHYGIPESEAAASVLGAAYAAAVRVLGPESTRDLLNQ